MEGVTQSAETETSCDISIAIEDDRTSMERRTMFPRAERPPPPGMAEVSRLAKTETSCHVSIAIQKDRTSIEQKLTLPWTMPEQRIPRVPHQLLKVNEKAYEPYVISIGPYHRGKDHLKEMEGQKVRSLKGLLQHTGQSVKIYLSAIREMVEEARNCYSEPLDVSMEEFVEMMVLDGCFIIQFLEGNLDDFCCSFPINDAIFHDLALVENQLPFFILRKLLDIIPKTFFESECSTDSESWLINQLLEAFEHRMPGLRVGRTCDDHSIKNVKHLVHLLHSNWLPLGSKAMDEDKKEQSKDGKLHSNWLPLGSKAMDEDKKEQSKDGKLHSNWLPLGKLHFNWLPLGSKAMDEDKKVQSKDGKWRFIRSATELREAGIEFKVVETRGDEKRSLFDIKFEKGILEMPTVRIEDSTESLYRNLIAYEQFYSKPPLYLTDYATLMNSLINSGKDVGLLCKSGIIDNWLGDDEEVAVLFNRLGDQINLDVKNFCYAQLFRDVNRHYETPWNAWKANLRHKYFNTPWAFISFLAATLLLLLTVLQTIFTVFHPS